MEDEGQIPGSSEFGTLLRRYRLAAGLSQEALAERARMSGHGVSALERGYRRTPQRETLGLLAGALALDDEQRLSFEAAATRVGVVRRGGSVGAGPWPDNTAANLPLALTSFVGREREIEEISTLVRAQRMVTLSGAGGVGKTQTALHVAAALRDTDAAAVCFVGLAPIANPSLVVTAIATAVGVRAVFDKPLLGTLVVYLKSRALLLILDNCEHVIGQTATISQALLADCPRVRILATSREPLRAAGEYSYRLPSLRVPSPEVGPLSATDAAAYEAIVLFSDRARAVDHRFTLTDENAPILSDICRRLDGIPLAIELAAARVNVLTPRQLHERLDERFRVLTGGSRDALPRQQTLRALIDWSHDLLDEREQVLFRRLGIFVNGFTFEGAVAVGGGEQLGELEVFDVLASLVDKSLVLAESQGEAVRYRLLESTRAYASEKLDDASERDLVAGRHLRYLRDYFAALREGRERTARHADSSTELQVELEDLRWAFDDALARSDVVDGAELLADIGGIWRDVGLDAEGRARCEAYLTALATDQSRLRARLSTALSFLLLGTHTARAFELATQAVEQARASGDASLLAEALRLYALTATRLHRLGDAERALAQAEAIPATATLLRMNLLDARARLSESQGDLETAARMRERGRMEQRSLGNPRGERLAAANLAEVEHARGRTQRAIAIVREMLPELRSGADKHGLSLILQNLAGYLVAIDDLPGAAAAAREAIGIRAAREPDHTHVAIAIEHLALAEALRGDGVLAATLEGYADAVFGRHGYPRQLTESTTYDRLTALLREELAPDELARLTAAGAALTPEAAIALALEESQST
jgi:predicted ATPase